MTTEQTLIARALIPAVRRLWWVIAVAAVIGGVASAGWSSMQTPQYQSTAAVHFSADDGASATALSQGSTYTLAQMLTYAQLAEGSTVLTPVVEELGLEGDAADLAEQIEVTIPQDTAILEVTVTTADGERSAEIATAVSKQLIEQVRAVTPETPEGDTTVSAEVIDEAVAPTVQSAPNTPRQAVIGLAGGAVVGLAIVLVIGLIRDPGRGSSSGRRAER